MKESRFNTGDRVRIKPRVGNQRTQWPNYTDDMVRLQDKTFKIVTVRAHRTFYIYSLSGGGGFEWHEDWLEPCGFISDELFEI